MDSLRHRVGVKLKAIRKARGLSQAELAFALDCEDTLISRYELGKTTPSLEQIYRLATALDCSVGELLPGLNDPEYEQRRVLLAQLRSLEETLRAEELSELLTFVQEVISRRTP